MNHTDYMNMALDLAEKGMGTTSPNPMVGAVIVKDGQVAGKGYHKVCGGPHAEVNAVDDAGPRARGAAIYVTLEPCNHTGKTPPCTKKIIEAGITTVYFAQDDPNPDVRGGGGEFLKQQGIEVVSGLCRERSEKLNEAFTKYIQTKRPFVTVKCAATLDGRIATRTGDSKWISCEKSRQFVHRLRHASDAIMVGVDTVINDDPNLTTRLEGLDGSDPVRIILDTRLRIPESAKVLSTESSSETIIITGPSIPEDKKKSIENKNVRVVPLAIQHDRVDLKDLTAFLGESKITSLLVEGGSRVIASCMNSGITDKVLFFYAPKILGGDDGIPICRGPGPALMNESIPVKNIEVKRFDDDIMIEGYL